MLRFWFSILLSICSLFLYLPEGSLQIPFLLSLIFLILIIRPKVFFFFLLPLFLLKIAHYILANIYIYSSYNAELIYAFFRNLVFGFILKYIQNRKVTKFDRNWKLFNVKFILYLRKFYVWIGFYFFQMSVKSKNSILF